MFAMVLLAVVAQTPVGQHYLADPGGRTPILPAAACPRIGGGWLPPPGPPSDRFIHEALAGAGRTPGDAIVRHRLEREELSEPRFIPGVGVARVWTLTYHCQVVGPDGPYVVYTDRTALVRVR